MTLNVLFLSPHYPDEMVHFTRGLTEVGARVIGASDAPREQLPAQVQGRLSGYVRVPRLMDEEAATRTLLDALRGQRIDRVETLWEPLVLLAARLREALGAPGLRCEEALLFRDKGLMKARLREAGVSTPAAWRARSAGRVREAAAAMGYPLIVKPISGAGSADTWRIDDADALEDVLPRLRHVEEVAVEQFISGREFTYDAITIEGEPVFESVTEYFPRPLIARSEHWVSPAQVTFRDPGARAELRAGLALGRDALRALGRGTGFSHLEWYLREDGEVFFGEVGARNGGGHLVDMMNYAHDIDVYREWARAVCHGAFEATPHRRYHVGMVFKRAHGEGRISHVEGLQAARARCGEWFIGHTLLPPGAPRRDWTQTLLSDGYLAVRHPDLGACREMVAMLARDVRLYAR